MEDIKISYIIYNIQKFQGTPWASIITTYLIKLVRTVPLKHFIEKLTINGYENYCFLVKSLKLAEKNIEHKLRHFFSKPKTKTTAPTIKDFLTDPV